MIKAFWYKSKNVGDTLTPIIVRHFTKQEVEWFDRCNGNKLIAVGSIMNALRKGDVVWGAGIMRETDKPKVNDNKFLAVRGKLTEKILGIDCGVYGDPALLMPLIYNPEVKGKRKDIGYVPHYVDKKFFKGKDFIDVMKPYKEVIDEILKCNKIVSSSLHGIILAEAYGIPAKWEKYSDEVLGNGFKFRDYLSGTGRTLKDVDEDGFFKPIDKIWRIQNELIYVLQQYYGK